jgi:16S rRNA (cytosine967-C5)-methyltransferase
MELSSPGLPARKAALAILSAILRRRVPLDIAAEEALASAKLEARDAAFARAIAGETMRRLGQLNVVIRAFVPKEPQEHKAGTALEILLAGACELLFLKVAPHAAVDAANKLAEADTKAVHFKPLINAVLRRIAREGEAIVAAQDAARLNTPDWLWPRWAENFGDATARAIAEAHAQVPPLDLTLKEADDPLPGLGGKRLAPGTVRRSEPGRVDAMPGFAEGRWWVQDFAAHLPARLFGDVAGKVAIDLCAAPGGKTAQLAAAGARVTSVDISSERLVRVDENLTRLKLSADLIAADARDWRPAEPAPVVLLDAPCTATGTIRRHPDIPWIKSASDIGVLAPLQADLLDAAAEMAAPGGLLVYAVCSLEPEEGIEQIESFLRRTPAFARASIEADEVPDAQFVTASGDLRTLPHYWNDKGGMDGFYAARLRRIT